MLRLDYREGVVPAWNEGVIPVSSQVAPLYNSRARAIRKRSTEIGLPRLRALLKYVKSRYG